MFPEVDRELLFAGAQSRTVRTWEFLTIIFLFNTKIWILIVSDPDPSIGTDICVRILVLI
jgi:hypothetical protein